MGDDGLKQLKLGTYRGIFLSRRLHCFTSFAFSPIPGASDTVSINGMELFAICWTNSGGYSDATARLRFGAA